MTSGKPNSVSNWPGRQGPADYGVMHPLILRVATPF